MPKTIEELDRVMLENPKVALRLARAQLLAATSSEEAVLLLGVCGSCHRCLGQLTLAKNTLLSALSKAQTHGPTVEAALQKRLAIVASAQGDFGEALRLNSDAISTFFIAGDSETVGKCLVERGAHHFYNGAYQKSIDASKAALEQLSENQFDYRFSALLGIAFVLREQGQSAKALEFAKRAESLAPKVAEAMKLSLLWFQGRLGGEFGYLDEARHAFGQLRSLLQKRGTAFDELNVIVDQIKIELLAENPERARIFALELLPSLEHLTLQKDVEKVICEIARLAIAGESIGIDKVEVASRAIEKGRVRSYPRTRRN